MPAWNGWYHVMGNSYGTWLPGDGRGFRTRRHREHVEGDYKHPPPRGTFERQHEHARRLMAREPVVLSVEAREGAVLAVRQALVGVHELEVLAIAVSSMHLHVLVRLPPRRKPTPSQPILSRCGLRECDPARYYMGIAKERSAKALAVEGLVPPGGVWARRGKVVPVRDRAHQVNVVHYILKHFEEGAAVWSFKAPDLVRVRRPTA